MNQLFADVDSAPGFRLQIDLFAQTVTTPRGLCLTFQIDAFRKECLLGNLDDIGVTLQHADSIKSYEEDRRRQEPWIFIGE